MASLCGIPPVASLEPPKPPHPFDAFDPLGTRGRLPKQHLPTAKKTPEKKSMTQAASVSHKAFPIDAVPPTAEIRALMTKKKTRSKMNAKRTTAAAVPA